MLGLDVDSESGIVAAADHKLMLLEAVGDGNSLTSLTSDIS